jgi:hypothetical protein
MIKLSVPLLKRFLAATKVIQKEQRTLLTIDNHIKSISDNKLLSIIVEPLFKDVRKFRRQHRTFITGMNMDDLEVLHTTHKQPIWEGLPSKKLYRLRRRVSNDYNNRMLED